MTTHAATRRTQFEMEIDVTFGDDDKARAFFIEDGEWRSSFYDVDDLDDLARMIAHAFHCEGDHYSMEHKALCRSPEAFGVFVRQPDGRYVSDKESGNYIGTTITVRYEMELEATFTDLLTKEPAQ